MVVKQVIMKAIILSFYNR